ncbi:MAG: hypothetical protein ABWY63_14245 [Hyphomicrobiaceae bacterium]
MAKRQKDSSTITLTVAEVRAFIDGEIVDKLLDALDEAQADANEEFDAVLSIVVTAGAS